MNKRLFFLIILTFFIKNSIGQILTFDEVQNLRTSSLNDVQNYLAKKNWEMVGVIKATTEELGKVVFGYYKDGEGGTITFYVGEFNNLSNRIAIEIYKLASFKNYINRLTILNYKMKDTKIEDEGIETIYQTKNTTCIVTTKRVKTNDKTNLPVYRFTFMDNFSNELLQEINK